MSHMIMPRHEKGTTLGGSGSGSKIVVGVDGSDGSIDALRWAARQAELTGAVLHVVTAWAFPEHHTPFGVIFDIAECADPTARARANLDAVIADVLGQHENVAVRPEVIPGNEAAVLLEARKAQTCWSSAAELVVRLPGWCWVR